MITENLLYPLLSLLPALLNLGILFYLLFFVPRLKTTDIFCLFVLFLLLWQAEDTIVRMCTTPETALFWVRILCVGWAGFAPVAFHFACRYTSLKWCYTRMSLLFIYVPFVVFYLLYIATSDIHVFAHRAGWNWIVTPRPGTLDGPQRLLISCYVVGTVIILFRYAYKMRNHKQKRLQSILIALGIFIPSVQGIITQIVFPVFLHIPDIPLTSSFLTLFSLATILSIRRYNLFNISKSVDVEAVLENLKNIVLVVSPDKEIIYMNPYGLQLLTKESTYNNSLGVQSIFASEAHYLSFASAALEPSLYGITVTDFSTVFRTSSGEKIDVLLSAELITNNKQVVGLLLVANDVTELSRTLRDLEKSNKELEQFVYAASHDLQEPLRKINAYLHRLEFKYKNEIDEKGMSYIKVAVKSGNYMRNLLQGLGEYANISKNEGSSGTTDMNDVMREVIKVLDPQIEQSGAVIDYKRLPVLNQAKAAQMQLLLQNLLSNAIKYSHHETVPQIKIYAEHTGDHWLFAVEDNGIGIDAEYREKVFVVFQQLHIEGKYEGTGIGLPICKKIVAQHGGHIWIDSNMQGGCTFFFTIPFSPLLLNSEA